MTWSDAFRSYITKRYLESPQKQASQALRVAPSMVHYWCNGATAREKVRKKIERWSKGEVPATLHVVMPATGTAG